MQAKVKREKRVGCGMVAALVAVGMTACGGGTPSAGQVGAFVRQHTECPPYSYEQPQWAPDGRSIVYTINDGTVSDVRRAWLDGSGDDLLVHGADQALLSPDPGPTGSGAHLLYRQLPQLGTRHFDFYLLDLATMQSRLIGRDLVWPGWLPGTGGQSIAYFSPGPGEYNRMPIDTREAVRLPGIPDDAGGWIAAPVWTQDGRTFAYADDRGGLSRVNIVDTAESRLTRVAPPGGPPCAFQLAEYPAGWSPDPPGPMLAVISWCGVNTTLRVVDRDGVELYNWGSQPIGLVREAAWSPGPGGRIAYMVETNHAFPVYTADADGSDARLLIADSVDLAWSPDGTQLAIIGRDSAGLLEIFTINADGSGQKQATQNPNAGRICLH